MTLRIPVSYSVVFDQENGGWPRIVGAEVDPVCSLAVGFFSPSPTEYPDDVQAVLDFMLESPSVSVGEVRDALRVSAFYQQIEASVIHDADQQTLHGRGTYERAFRDALIAHAQDHMPDQSRLQMATESHSWASNMPPSAGQAVRSRLGRPILPDDD